jgi:hypothetical protein
LNYVPQLTHPRRTLVVPLLAAALGAGVATATFAVVNIEDEASVSLPAVQSAPPSDVLAGERNDGGPAEGTAQQIMTPAGERAYSGAAPTRKLDGTTDTPSPAPVELPASTAPAYPTPAPRYDGGPNEGSSAGAITDTQPPKGVVVNPESRYDGGPNEGSSAGAIAQP